MKKIYYNNIPFTYTKDEFLNFVMGPGEDRDEDDQDTVLEMMREAEALANPKAVCRIAEIMDRSDDWVEIGGERITSALVVKNLEHAHRVIAYVATCGTELEEWSMQFTDYLEQYWADRIKLFFLGKISGHMHEQLRKDYFPAGHMSFMNPGSLKEWPLPQQAVLFRIVGEVTEEIGVRLTDSFLMLPSKSSSGFYFASEEAYENCQLCPILSCPTRRAPFQGEV